MINNKKILCVITARKGSKGIPGKNHRLLLDKPLFMWSTLSAIKSKYIDQIVISSDCDSVKRCFFDFLSKEYMIYSKKDEYDNLHFIHRPPEYSTDTSKNEEALIHAYVNFVEKLNFNPDIIINLQPTSPIRNNNLIDNCIEEYSKGDYDSLLTGEKMTPFFWKKIKKDKWEHTGTKNCCKRKMRQQMLESDFTWHNDGNIYISNTEMLLKTNCRIGKKPCVFETDKFQSMQIDEEDDFLIIENIIKTKKINLI